MKLPVKHCGIVIVVGLLFLRFILLEIDPPLFFEGLGQGQLTDPYHLTFAARNAVLFGDWNPFDFYRWDVFKYSLISGLSYLIFMDSGVSRITANLSAIILSTGGILFFLMGLTKYWKSREIILTAVLLFANSTLFFYGRIPFLENGLIFISGLTFFVFSRYHDRLWGCLITGVLVSLAGIFGKLFGLLLIFPVMLTMLYLYRLRAVKPILITLFGLIGGGILYVALLHGNDLTLLTNYYGEHTVGMYGPPPGLQSPLRFIEMLLKYGEDTLTKYNPFLILLSALSLIVILLSFRLEKAPRKELLPLLFCLGWFLGGIVGLMPFHYRPMRYSVFLLLPASAYISYVIVYLSQKDLKLSLGNKWLTIPGILFATWFILAQFHVFINASGTRLSAGVESVYFSAPLAIIATGLLWRWLREDRTIPGKRFIYRSFIVLMVASLCYHGLFIYKGLVQPGEYLKSYNDELNMIINEHSTLTGPYAPALTIDNDLKGVIYMFTLSVIEEELFTRFPITHIATDKSNWIRAVKDFPFLASSTKLVEMIVRERTIYIYRLPNNIAPPTDFERGRMYAVGQKHDSALVYLNRFSGKNPSSIFGRLYLALEQSRAGLIGDAIKSLDELVEDKPNNYLIHTFCAKVYSEIYESTDNSKYRQLADKNTTIARALNWRVSEILY